MHAVMARINGETVICAYPLFFNGSADTGISTTFSKQIKDIETAAAICCGGF